MAIATVTTKLSLDRFAQLVGLDPLHFNQVLVQDLAPATSCADPILQYDWQDFQRTGRESIARAIRDVEDDLENWLNFKLIPSFFNGQLINYPRPSNPELFHASLYDPRGTVRAVWLGPQSGYAISGGVETKTLIEANSAIVYTDVDLDGYFETATITTTVLPGTKPEEVAIYYPGNNGSDDFEVRLTVVNITGTTAVIMCKREQLVRPELLFALKPQGVDGLDDTLFLNTVDVYRHWLDPTQSQVQFQWEQTPFMPGSLAVAYFVQYGAMLMRDKRLGYADLEPAHYDATSNMFVLDLFNNPLRMPDNALVWFKAGYPLIGNKMDPRLEQCIMRMTLAKLWRPICQCDNLRTNNEYWAFDFAMNTPQNTQQISRRKLDNPLGTTRGALATWEAILRLRLPDPASTH